MNPDNRLEELERKIERIDAALRQLAEMDPQYRRTIEKIVGNTSQEAVTDYDQAVNESGSSSFNVPMQFDGLVLVDGKLFGFYNPQ